MHRTLNTCSALFCIMDLGHSEGFCFPAVLWVFVIEPLKTQTFIFCLCWRHCDKQAGGKKWRVKDWGHLPSAVKEALAAAAAFSRAIRIKPKSRGALPIRLALPPVIAAKKHDTSWHDKHDDTNHLFSILKVLVGGLLYNSRLMAQFKSTTVNRTVRKHNLAGLKRTHETLNYFFYWLLSEFQQVT